MVDILAGSDLTEEIVGMSHSGNSIKIYKYDGTSEVRPIFFFALSHKEDLSGHGSTQIGGDLHYKHLYQFNTLRTYRAFMKPHYEDVYTIKDPIKNTLVTSGMRMYRNIPLDKLCVLSFDIETTGLQPFAYDARVLIISNTWRDRNGAIHHKIFTGDDYGWDDRAMIDAWTQWVAGEIDPDVLCGHNIYSFDIPYLEARGGGNLRLGREHAMLEYEYKEREFRLDAGRFLKFKLAICPGREIIDTLLLAYKADTAKKLSSYALKKIVEQLGMEDKGRVFYDAGKIRINYKIPSEWEKIKKYAEMDAWDGLKVFDYFVAPFFYMTQFIPMTLQQICISASGGQVNTMLIGYYLCKAHSIPQASAKRKYKGAISMGDPGVYKNVWSLDVASLYPSIIIQYNVYDPNKDPLGAIYDLTVRLREDRLKFKKLGKETGLKMYKDMDGSLKILINSIYGSFGCQGLNFNSMECADGITGYGRLLLRTAILWLTDKRNDELERFIQTSSYQGQATLDSINEIEKKLTQVPTQDSDK
jgi:DNA polymerase elongation subunit (family B)